MKKRTRFGLVVAGLFFVSLVLCVIFSGPWSLSAILFLGLSLQLLNHVRYEHGEFDSLDEKDREDYGDDMMLMVTYNVWLYGAAMLIPLVIAGISYACTQNQMGWEWLVSLGKFGLSATLIVCTLSALVVCVWSAAVLWIIRSDQRNIIAN